jgi:fucose 4-O-acetylase-like acetyltransferase
MSAPATNNRLDYLDAVRAFALLLGIVFHASMSFVPFFIGWAVMDISTSSIVTNFMLVSHSFRMELFFLIAGFFSHMTFHKKGASVFISSRLTRIAIPFVVGWFILRPLIISSWVMGGQSMQGEVDILNHRHPIGNE